MIKQKLSDEERKARRAEYHKQYQLEHKEHIAEYQKCWREANREYKVEYDRKYRQEHKAEIAERRKEYSKTFRKKYRQTPMGRASHMVSTYKQKDRKHNRGECTITAKWMVDNIFSKPCHYCGETDWTKLGCDRIDNSKPHTEDNVVPCCRKCNDKRNIKNYEEFKKEMESQS